MSRIFGWVLLVIAVIGSALGTAAPAHAESIGTAHSSVREQVYCPGTPTPRLVVGQQARVTPGLPNALRNSPGLNYTGSVVIGYIPGSGVVTVLGGPVCQDGYLWWQVNFAGQIGWTPEGQGYTYWIDPLAPTPQQCPGSLPARMVIGRAGRVTPGLPNALRDRPGLTWTGSRVIGRIPGTGVFTVVSGPVCAAGYTWWQVNYNGVIGWTAEGNAWVYWIEPL
jgi:hypothetical protein